MGVKLVILLVKEPVPLPLVVWLLLTVGFCDVLQQTPRAVTVAPPSDVTLPPQVAEVVDIFVTLFVVKVGAKQLTVTVTLAVPVPPHELVPVTVYVVVDVGLTVILLPVLPLLQV